MSADDTISIAGEVVINKLYIVSGDEKVKVDLTGMMIEVDIYEDIFSHTLSGSITITENFNLIHSLPIIGEEVIEIEFKTPGIKKTFSKQFFLYKIGRKMIDANSKNLYLLNIISVEALKDLNTKISKAFTGMPHTIAEEIFNKYLKVDTKLDIKQAANNIKFISLYWSPFKCINFALSRAIGIDKFKTPTYLLYETNQGFKVRSLNDLFKEEPISEFFFDKKNMRNIMPDGESTRDIDREFKQIEKFDIIESMDYVDRLMNGVYSFKVFDINILTKTIKKQIYNYWDNFEDTNHLGEHPTHSKYVFFNDENCRIEWVVTNPYVYDNIKTDLKAEILSKRLPLLAQTEMITVEITVPGRLGIECGNTVNLNMKNYETKKTEDATVSDMDKYYSGKYLVTSIEHRLTQTRHKMSMQLVKDSFNSKVEFKPSL
jgi:hypothetical protein